MTQSQPTRRKLLLQAAGMGLTVDLLARQAFADTEHSMASRKFVFINCRGGMDGMTISPPVGDPDYVGLRGKIALGDEALNLDSTFSLHPAMTASHGLARAGQLRIAPAIATPDRARSHFEAQDVLESGAPTQYGATSGWLNRALVALKSQRKIEAISIGTTAPLILKGTYEVASWSPGRGMGSETRLPGLLQDLYRNDPLLGPALARGLSTEDMATAAMSAMSAPSAPQASGTGTQAYARQGAAVAERLGRSVAAILTEPGGPQIAAMSLDAFDTHANQGAAEGQLANRLASLDALIGGLQSGLGASWASTVVVVATEFGRTARVNGTGGTDHGTASTALVLGGSLKPGGIIGDWPGLKPAALYENRDLAPTLDMRSLFKSVLGDHMGLDLLALSTRVFPDSAAIKPVSGLV